ncbi:GNAT family N-acetyltransferase [Amaricoccus sp.]|uniref:GNAT family N-acetyltransferase n=1 Tax=Amaricoccus sp. TaxID=1872485 RepID=UPI001B73B01F|nr:GNAT family N-acetyltransferase [Amaricoccus sp.]MBP7241683.1 GNAT family N-acetyltransferase [Amaricoccus sp.]
MPARPEPVRLRPARREDAADLARLIDLAGEGLARHVWAGMAGPGEDPMAVGARRAARDEGAFSWRNAVAAEAAGAVAGALVTYRIAAAEPVEGLPALFRPLQALENLAVGTQYVNAVAVCPRFRRRGVGRALMAEAARRSAGAAGLSLIVADANAGAIVLYRACGFAEAAREAIAIADGWSGHGADWVLMRAPAARG